MLSGVAEHAGGTGDAVGEAPVEVIARAVICTPGGVLLARQRGKSWSFLPGGHAEPGETLAVTLARELDEELGLAVAGAVPAGMVEHSYEEDGVVRHELNVVFAVTTSQREFRSREDHLSFHVVAWDDLDSHRIRPGPVHAALLTWAAGRAPFLSVLPAPGAAS
jgi:8-oxo-dGTP pyrophosphatase MutT (NUDIX family)